MRLPGACVIVGDRYAQKKNLKPIGRFLGFAVAGCEPDEMGIGPVFAVPKVLKRLGLTVADIDLTATAGRVVVQYGGSVKAENAADLLARPDIDGALVGGASLKAADFLGIVAAARGLGK